MFNSHRFWNQQFVLAAVVDDFSYDAAADERFSWWGQEKNGFQFFVSQSTIGVGYGFFKFKICRISEASEDKLGIFLKAIING